MRSHYGPACSDIPQDGHLPVPMPILGLDVQVPSRVTTLLTRTPPPPPYSFSSSGTTAAAMDWHISTQVDWGSSFWPNTCVIVPTRQVCPTHNTLEHHHSRTPRGLDSALLGTGGSRHYHPLMLCLPGIMICGLARTPALRQKAMYFVPCCLFAFGPIIGRGTEYLPYCVPLVVALAPLGPS